MSIRPFYRSSRSTNASGFASFHTNTQERPTDRPWRRSRFQTLSYVSASGSPLNVSSQHFLPAGVSGSLSGSAL